MSTLTEWIMGHKRSTLPAVHRSTHTYVVGQSGTGKSRALESWVMQDILAGHGVGVIDPHGDLFHNLCCRLAAKPQVWERIVILDPLDPHWVVGFNPLEAVANLHPERLALYMTDVAIKIWNLNPTAAPRMVWLLSNSFLALCDLGLSILDLPRFLIDREYRSSLLPKVRNQTARDYFLYEFPKSNAAVHQWITPVLNKIGGLIFDPDIRLMFTGESTINFREIMDRKMIFLINLPKGILGEGSSALLAAFLVAHMQRAALARADSQNRTPFYLYLDEFQNYTTDNIKDILSESRKYALSLTLAHQYLDQLSGELRSGVINTAGTLVSFRVGYHDAHHLAKEIFPAPDYIETFETQLKFRHTHQVPIPFLHNSTKPLGWDGLALELAGLKSRQFWVRKRGPYKPTKLYSFYMPDPVYSHELTQQIEELRDYSGQHFGRAKQKIQKQKPRPVNRVEDIPLWTG